MSLVLVCSLVGYPLVVSVASFVGADNRLMSIGFRFGLVFLSLAILLAAVAGNVKLRRGTYWIPLIVFWLCYLSRIVFETLVYVESTLSRPPQEYLIWAIGVCLLPMLAMSAVQSHHRLTRSASLLFYVGLATAIGVLVTAFRNLSVLSPTGGSGGRFALESLNPISIGHVGGVLIVLCAFFVLGKKEATKPSMALVVVAVLLGGMLLVASGSRGPMLSTAFAITVLFFAALQPVRRIQLLVLLVLFMIGGIYAASYVESQFGFTPLARIVSIFDSGTDRSASIRLTLLSDAWAQFLESPLLGSGLEEKNSRYYPHNVIVEAYMATGVVGGTAFVAFVAMAVLHSMRLLVIGSEHVWVAQLCLYFLVAVQVSGTLWASGAMWVTSTLAIVVSTQMPRVLRSAQAAFHPQN